MHECSWALHPQAVVPVAQESCVDAQTNVATYTLPNEWRCFVCSDWAIMGKDAWKNLPFQYVVPTWHASQLRACATVS